MGPKQETARGRYTLRTINAQNLPFIMSQSGADRVEVTPGTLMVNADLTFRETVGVRTIQNGGVSTGEQTTSGTYKQVGGRIDFIPSTGGSYTGTVDAGRVRFIERGLNGRLRARGWVVTSRAPRG